MKGLNSLANRRKEQSQSKRNMYFKLFLADAQEYARIRFLEDTDDIYWGPFHTISRTKNGKNRFFNILCPLADENSGCINCDCNLTDEEKGRFSFHAFTWVYVYALGKKTPWPGEDPGEVVTRGRERFYERVIDKPQLLQLKGTLLDLVNEAAASSESLTDRDYVLKRITPRNTGQKSVTYTLTGDVPSEFTEEIIDLPPITDPLIAEAEFAMGKRLTSYNYLRSEPITDDDAVSLDEDIDDLQL